MKTLLLTLAFALSAPLSALAGAPADLVKSFYTPVGYEADPAVRDRFVDPARALFEKNDKASERGDICIDFVPSIDAQDLDQSVIDRTLKLVENVDGDAATVTASFDLFAGEDGSSRIILWSLAKVDGTWKVSDIASQTNGWTLGTLGCGEE
jgi:hypothetical protein